MKAKYVISCKGDTTANVPAVCELFTDGRIFLLWVNHFMRGTRYSK